MTRDLTSLMTKAATVAAQHAEHEAAREARVSAEGDLLAAATAAVLPALRALSTRIVTARIVSQAGRTDKDALGIPGVYVTSPRLFIHEPGPRLQQGAWEGTDLFLLQDGNWVLLVYDGIDATATTGVSEWGSDMVPLTPYDVVEMMPLDVVLDALSRSLDKQLEGNKDRRTAATLERAARLKALAVLVRSSL